MNFFKKIKNIHFVGIGGAGMIGIARLLLQKGYKVSGSDINQSYELKKIKKEGAKVFIGHNKSHIKSADLIVVSSAIDKKNPEIIEGIKNDITIIPRAEMLGSIMRGYESIAIAGSHGKTTTTSMIAKIFSSANLSPTYVVGGKVLSTDENSNLGQGNYLIAEADESDGSFIHLNPDVAVLTNIDDDHLVHYENNFENLLNAFIQFSENIPFYGYIIINADDKNIRKIAKRISRKQVTFGKTKTADFYISNVMYRSGYQNFDINDNQRNKKYSFSIQQPGMHNVFNAAASIAVAIEEGLPIKSIKKGIKELPCIGDGRQSGTSAAPSILNASPESAVGGGLAWLKTGDMIKIDLNNYTADMLIDEEEIEKRKLDGVPPYPESQTPWQEIYRKNVGQIDKGAVLEDSVKFQDIKKDLPRNNH